MLRQKQMEERRRRILDAAEHLIRKTGGTEFSMIAVAATAEVSPATPYNLFRSKAALLYALLNRSLDAIIQEGLSFSGDDPIARVLEAAADAADMFTRDPTFLRPLYQFLIGVHDPVHRPRFMERSLAFWKTALTASSRGELLSKEIDHEGLARALAIHFLGALDLWVHQELDEEGFRAQVVSGSALLLWAIADPEQQSLLMRRLQAAKRKRPRQFAIQRTSVVTLPTSRQARSSQ